MSEVLQSIQLIHSASAPIFFSEYRTDLIDKWNTVMRAPRLDDPNILRIVNTKVATNRVIIEGQTLPTVNWYKTMVQDFAQEYVEYMHHLGMEQVSGEVFAGLEGSQHGGIFTVAHKFVIEAPSIFMRGFFPSGVIIVQCGFHTYFATVNVLTFAYQSEMRALRATDEAFVKQCTVLQTRSHIVSFSYDFHLRYLQEQLKNSAQELPF
eukprot:jgi/Hompol1/4432/HPOL_007107-RA